MSNVFQEELIRRGITSGSQLAERLSAPAAIFFFAGGPRPYAELWHWDGEGGRTVSTHWPRFPNMTLTASRKKTVEAAQNEAAKDLGLVQWSRSPFSNCWLPTRIVDEARAQFMGESPSKTG